MLVLCAASFASAQIALTVTGIDPVAGPVFGGTFVTVSGSGFATFYSPQVRIGGSPLLNQEVEDDSHITGIVPPRNGSGCVLGGIVDVVVFGLLGAFAVLPAGFTYTPASVSPYGTGQANGPQASLAINGAGLGVGSCGPYFVPLVPGAMLTLAWNGPPGAAYVLFAGSLRTAHWWFGCAGYADIGVWPYNDLAQVMAGDLNTLGIASQSFAIPVLPPGFSTAIQGAVIQPSGCPFVLTATFHFTG